MGSQQYQTIKIWKRTLKMLRNMYAETGEPMIKILDRLVEQEWQKSQEEQHHDRERLYHETM